MAEKIKVLMNCSFNNSLVNQGDESYLFTEIYNNAFTVSEGYYNGGVLSCLNYFDLNQNWEISFDYKWVNNLSSTWNHLFAFGTHKYSSANTDTAPYAIGINDVKSTTTSLYTINNIDTNWHKYNISYDTKSSAILVYIDNKLVNTLEGITFKSKVKGLYFNGGLATSITGCIKNFIFKVTIPESEISDSDSQQSSEQSTTDDSSTSQQDDGNNDKDIVEPVPSSEGFLQNVTLKRVLRRIVVIDVDTSKSDFTEHTTCSGMALGLGRFNKLKTYIDSKYLVSLNFNDSNITDHGSLGLRWKGTNLTSENFVKSRINPSHPYNKALYLKGKNTIISTTPKIKNFNITDFCVELDFEVSDRLIFNLPYTKCYIACSDINVAGEYHSSLANFYLLPKYKDKKELLTLTIESNDLYRNTGNILYTYGYIERNKMYRVKYVREKNRFFILINNELVFDKTIDNTIIYEEGYSKPNRRYYGPNYIKSITSGLGTSIYPSNTQIPFIGYIETFNISGISRYNSRGKLIYIEKIFITSTSHISQRAKITVRFRGRYRRLPKPPLDPRNYDPKLVDVLEDDILVYVPCKQPDFDSDVEYSKRVPRENNYKAEKVNGAYYADYWKEGYGAIGPK